MFSTVVAFAGFLARVGPNVHYQVKTLRECFAANVTGKRFLVAVDEKVFGQDAIRAVAFAADFTLKGFFPWNIENTLTDTKKWTFEKLIQFDNL